MKKMRPHHANPTMKDVLSDLLNDAASAAYDLRHAIIELADRLDDYEPVWADVLCDLLIVTKANEDEADAREDIRRQVEEWEGRNNA